MVAPDRHLHLRDGASLASVVPFSARVFGRAVVMPNLKPPVRTLADAAAYRQRILAAVPPGLVFEPLMTLYLTGASRYSAAWTVPHSVLLADKTTAEDVAAAAASGFVAACKYYPAGATTNSADGVTDVHKARVCCTRFGRLSLVPRSQPHWRRWLLRACRCWCTAR
jgi:dihydroorotase